MTFNNFNLGRKLQQG